MDAGIPGTGTPLLGLPQLRQLQRRALEAVADRVATPDAPAGPSGPRETLRRAATSTTALAEAARRAAAALSAAGFEPAAEVADAVSTSAQALRILAEIELRATPGP